MGYELIRCCMPLSLENQVSPMVIQLNSFAVMGHGISVLYFYDYRAFERGI
jgi:hypothetical protein